MKRFTAGPGGLALLLILTACPEPEEPLSTEAVQLRNRGLAQLENEDPEAAEATYRRLAELVTRDPLPEANLAIALLRQQKSEEALAAIDGALAKAPERGDLLAIRGDILQWSGEPEAALETYRRAARDRPQDLEVLYALYRQATTLESEAAARAAAEVTRSLARLRPENVVVLLARAKEGIASGDRSEASTALLRIRELLWQAPGPSERAMGAALETLEGDDLRAARTSVLRLENVLKVSAMYRESLRELLTGIQGIPVLRFAAEPPVRDFGPAAPLTFSAQQLSEAPGTLLAAGDFDGDGLQDLVQAAIGEAPHLLLRRSGSRQAERIPLPVAADGLSISDLDNDGLLDLLAFGAGGLGYWRGDGQGGLDEATAELGLEGLKAAAAAQLDYDIEGDLDLVLGGDQGLELLRNNLQGPLLAVGGKTLPGASRPVRDLVATDLDRDGDLDLVVAHASGLQFLRNLRQGTFEDATDEAGLGGAPAARTLLAEDLDRDGWPDLVAAGEGLRVLWNEAATFPASPQLLAAGTFEAVVAFDGDLDGRRDLAAAGPAALVLLQQQGDGTFLERQVPDAPRGFSDLASLDADQDGDPDLLAIGEGGLFQLTNTTSSENSWLTLRLRGLDQGNSKNNLLGLGATIEVFSGDAYQFFEASRDLHTIGLGSLDRADVLRVVWTNGVPQNRLQVAGRQLVVEEQVLKGSCPFLYAWNGEEMAFVTDLLWGAPLGMPVAAGVWAGADPQELVRVDGAVPRDGRYDLRITEELWEAAFFDFVRLWVVDHPQGVEVASSLRIELGRKVEDRVLASRRVRPVEGAWDAAGREVTGRVRTRDEVYADGYRRSAYQGIAEEPWAFTFDLGEAPGRGVRLHLDGWIFPADASLNLAVDQRTDLVWTPPRLEVETGQGWQVLMPTMAFPAGKTKTMIIDTPPLPAGARRLRIVTTQWLSWDRVAWTVNPVDEEARVVARLAPMRADLRYRGFSEARRSAPNGPHVFVYGSRLEGSPWLPFPGAYTRFGDVLGLLEEADDRSVVLAPGDEIQLLFDGAHLAPPGPGWQRTVFLESHGWDKDADRNTYAAQQVEPLPFRAMSGYPYGADEAPPEHFESYRQEWLTRRIEAPVGPQSRHQRQPRAQH